MIVLDSSALLAMFFREPGHERVLAVLNDAMMSVVNALETLSRLTRDGRDADLMAARIVATGVSLEPLDWSQVIAAARLEPLTRHLGLSLGDRVCLALAIERALPVLSADRAWGRLEIGVQVQLIR